MYIAQYQKARQIAYVQILSFFLSCLQLLSGHEGPVSSVSFCPSRSLLVSGSWDKTLRLWDVFEQKGNVENLTHPADGGCGYFSVVGVVIAVVWKYCYCMYIEVKRSCI